MSTPEEVLHEHPFFRGFSEEYLQRLIDVARPMHIDPNHFIFRQGSVTDCFLAVYQGDVALELHVPGKGARIIHTVHEGEVLGWAWLFPPYKSLFDARALNAVKSICLQADKLRAQVEDDHHFGYEMLRRFSEVIIERLDVTRLQLLDVYGDAH